MAGADAQRLSPRGRDDPSFLGGGAHLRPSRPGTGPPKRRHPRAAVESVRPDAGGPADGLGRATELPVTTRRDGRTEMAVLAGLLSRAWNLSPGASCYRAELGRGPALIGSEEVGSCMCGPMKLLDCRSWRTRIWRNGLPRA